MKLTYRKVGDYYIPKLNITNEKISKWELGKYGRARLKFLREYKKGLYTSLMMKNELQKDLSDIERRAKHAEKFLINKMVKEEQIDEQLKEQDQMKWVGLMNNIKRTAVDTVMRKIVCR